MEKVLTKLIQADPNQPRKLFAADAMHRLTESIKREGIITPLVVEKIGDGYLLIDGERRFRAATELGLKEIPVVIEETRNEVERKLRQFAVQEQHEAWSPVEKAIALDTLASTLGIGLGEVCKLLNISVGNTSKYLAFSRLADKEGYAKSEIPLDFAGYISATKNYAKRLTIDKLGKDFTKSDEKKLERRIVQDIKNGSIDNRTAITKLSYAFNKAPKSIEEYMNNPSMTPTNLYLKTGAQGARALQNVLYNAGFLSTHINKFMSVQDVEVPQSTISTLKITRDNLKKFLDAYDQ